MNMGSGIILVIALGFFDYIFNYLTYEYRVSVCGPEIFSLCSLEYMSWYYFVNGIFIIAMAAAVLKGGSVFSD